MDYSLAADISESDNCQEESYIVWLYDGYCDLFQ